MFQINSVVFFAQVTAQCRNFTLLQSLMRKCDHCLKMTFHDAFSFHATLHPTLLAGCCMSLLFCFSSCSAPSTGALIVRVLHTHTDQTLSVQLVAIRLIFATTLELMSSILRVYFSVVLLVPRIYCVNYDAESGVLHLLCCLPVQYKMSSEDVNMLLQWKHTHY